MLPLMPLTESSYGRTFTEVAKLTSSAGAVTTQGSPSERPKLRRATALMRSLSFSPVSSATKIPSVSLPFLPLIRTVSPGTNPPSSITDAGTATMLSSSAPTSAVASHTNLSFPDIVSCLNVDLASESLSLTCVGRLRVG